MRSRLTGIAVLTVLTSLVPVAAVVEERLAEALATELAYREANGFGNADPTSPQALERYLDRASRLKKHFQEVLFLEPERGAVVTLTEADAPHLVVLGAVAVAMAQYVTDMAAGGYAAVVCGRQLAVR